MALAEVVAIPVAPTSWAFWLLVLMPPCTATGSIALPVTGAGSIASPPPLPRRTFLLAKLARSLAKKLDLWSADVVSVVVVAGSGGRAS